jgi:hypothetical protein
MTKLPRRRGGTLRLGIACGAVLAAALLLPTHAGAGGGADGRKVIGEASAPGFRVKVTARRAGDSNAATVRIAAFGRAGDRLGRALVVGERRGWFWRVVTRPYGVRKLSLAFAGDSRIPARIGLRLLISPSIGPSGTFRFVVENRRLVAVDV